MINIVQMYLLIDQLLTCSLVTRTGESIGPGETTQFRGNIMTFFFTLSMWPMCLIGCIVQASQDNEEKQQALDSLRSELAVSLQSSSGIKQLFNLPPLISQTEHLGSSAFCNLKVP